MQNVSMIALAAALTVVAGTAGCDSGTPSAPTEASQSFSAATAPVAMPYYARVERPFLVHTNEWAAVIFYRPTACVPADFNLLDLFDIPGAFFCGPQTVEGFELRKDNAPGAPFQQITHGLGAVPVWLVNWTEFAAALQDDVLTRSELEGLPSLLRGTATEFSEMLQPLPTRMPSRLVISAAGSVPDGRMFQLHFNEFKHVDIRVY